MRKKLMKPALTLIDSQPIPVLLSNILFMLSGVCESQNFIKKYVTFNFKNINKKVC